VAIFPFVFVGSYSMLRCLSALSVLASGFVSLFSVHSYIIKECKHTTLCLVRITSVTNTANNMCKGQENELGMNRAV
jgi:hypothetical protein